MVAKQGVEHMLMKTLKELGDATAKLEDLGGAEAAEIGAEDPE